jgi:predicted Zn-dependent protease
MVGDVDFLLVDGTTSNAFTAGGPQVYATAGLLRVCPTEDQFAAALAHAYAHVLCRHVTVPAAAPPADATKLALAYVSSRYTPAQERQADDLAVALFAHAGWSVDEYAGLLQTLGGTPVTAARLTDVRPLIQTLAAPAADWQQPPVADRKRYSANQVAAASVIWPTGTDAQSARRARLIIAAYPNCLLGNDTPAQLRARSDLQPPPPPPPPTEANPWGKGLPGGR